MLLAIYIEHTHPNEKLDLPFGGIQTQLLELLPEYQKHKNLKISLITRYSECHSSSNNFKILQINRFSGSIIGKIYFYLLSFFKMAKIHKIEHIDLINTHTFSYSVITPFLLKLVFKIPILMKIPIDFRSHIQDVYLMKKNTMLKKLICYSWLKLFQKFLIKKVDYIRVINSRMYEELKELKYPTARILRIPNGIRLDKYNKMDKNAHEGIIFGFVGRLSQFKNLRYMLGEFKGYFNKYALDKLYIFGEGPEIEYINNFIEKNGLSNNIYLLGYERNKEKIYANLDVLIDPSHGQGISNANLEAMSTNTLLIASKVDGNIDLIRDGETGLLFEPRNKGALLEKLLYYKELPEIAKSMTEKARRLISETYDIESISEDIINFILNGN